MVLKRNKQTEIVDFGNGIILHFITDGDTIENLRKYEEDAKTALDNNPCLLNRLDYIYCKADRIQAEGNRDKAVEYLENEINATNDLNNSPEVLMKWMDCLTLTAELLLRLKRPNDAFLYADRVYEICLNHFSDSDEFVYGEELYALCLYALGENEKAMEFYADAVERIDDYIADLQRLRDGIKENLDELKA